ncbi:restriction endonuclease subunit S [Fusobacterium necrophorum]|uniref:restriction endonuclease subunit S n=1 Tax=Fusobacterium necrophorum TaxID=859 RepID=UPI00370E5E01
MSKIMDMIKNEKVEWKKLGEVCEIINGYAFKSSKYTIQGIRVIRISDVQNGFISDKDLKFYPIDSKNEILNYMLKENDLVLSLTGNVGRVAIITKDILPAGLNQRVACLRAKNTCLSRYLFHFLNQEKFEKKAMQNASGGGQKNLSTNWLLKFEIPIPSLETQEKIVKILDKFTNYVTELQAELQARNKQYTYYRDKLLSEEYLSKISEQMIGKNFVEWKRLGELFEFKNGLNKGKEFFGKGTPIINYTDVYKKNKIYSVDLVGLVETTEEEQKRYNVKRGDVFFTRTSETQEEIGKTSVLLEDIEKGVFSGFVLRARPLTEQLLPEYCAYCFETHEFRKNVIRYSTYTTRALTNGGTLSNLEIPLPSLEIQEKVVKILDKFQELLQDTKGLLPQEIEQRQKQYEYYREKLLTFEAKYDTTQRNATQLYK